MIEPEDIGPGHPAYALPPGLTDALSHCSAYGELANVLLLGSSPAESRAMRSLVAAVLPLRGFFLYAPAAGWRDTYGATLRVRDCFDESAFWQLIDDDECATMIVADSPREIRSRLPALLRSPEGVPCRIARYTPLPD